MGLVSFLMGKLSDRQLALVAGQVAGKSHLEVRQLVERRAAGMKIHEACGYVRARSAQSIYDHVDRALQAFPRQPATVRAELVALATEAVVSSVMRDLTCVPMQTRAFRRAA